MKLTTRVSLLLASVFLVLAAGARPAPAPAPQAPASLEIPATDDGLPGAGPIRRYDWFRKLWLARRTAWAARAQEDHGAFVFLGDSITQGWGDQMRGSFPGLKVANRGISGDTTRGVLIRLKEDVLDLDPEGIVLLIGTNDLEEHADPETIAGNLKLILAKIKEHNPKTPVILCQVFPSSASKSRPSSLIKQVNRLYAAAVKGDPQITWIETWILFANASGDAKPEEFPDLLHPNDAGYAKWTGALHPIFATLGLMDNEPDHWTPDPGFTSMFNGHDLSGWGFRPTAPDDVRAAKQKNSPAWPIVTGQVSFDGKTESDDGRYVAKNGRLIVVTPAEVRRIQKLSTTREFPRDFVLKLEFRASVYADSGVFIRDPQLQCRDFLLAGPYKDLKLYKPQDWNEMVVTVRGGKALCTCNGEVLEAAMSVPATGPIGLEGDRGQMEYRHLEFQELP